MKDAVLLTDEQSVSDYDYLVAVLVDHEGCGSRVWELWGFADEQAIPDFIQRYKGYIRVPTLQLDIALEGMRRLFRDP